MDQKGFVMIFNISARSVTLALIINVFASLTAFAQSSYELTCRNKAKEIAAETYKNCVTEQRQSQIEQIRKDYKEKMAELKNHYDSELKKISNGQSVSKQNQSLSKEINSPKSTAPTKTASKNMRASGARSLPKKTVKTEVIDLTTGSAESTPVSTQMPPQSLDESSGSSQNRLNNESENAQDVEVVELPTQE